MAAAGLAGGATAQPAAAATTSLPPPPSSCTQGPTYPTSSAGYGVPIANLIVNGSLTQGLTKITNIDATVCGLLDFPSFTADIPASQIHYSVANLTIDGFVTAGTADIAADGPSLAVTSRTPAPNGGLVFTLTAHTADVLNLSLGVSCDVDLSAVLNTNPAEGGTALVGPLTGAQGAAYATGSDVTVSALTPNTPGDLLESTTCSLLNAVLRPQTTTATFRAPLDFYSSLTGF